MIRDDPIRKEFVPNYLLYRGREREQGGVSLRLKGGETVAVPAPSALLRVEGHFCMSADVHASNCIRVIDHGGQKVRLLELTNY